MFVCHSIYVWGLWDPRTLYEHSKKKANPKLVGKEKGGTPMKIMKLYVQNSMYPTVRQKIILGGWGGVGLY